MVPKTSKSSPTFAKVSACFVVSIPYFIFFARIVSFAGALNKTGKLRIFNFTRHIAVCTIKVTTVKITELAFFNLNLRSISSLVGNTQMSSQKTVFLVASWLNTFFPLKTRFFVY